MGEMECSILVFILITGIGLCHELLLKRASEIFSGLSPHDNL